jgi:pimeloyl-ACP methyl ester carboxylesterase
MNRPQTQYVKNGGVNIAYQVFGSGAIDLVFVSGWVSNLEFAWQEPSYARFFELLGSFARVIMFDKRGTGLSDSDGRPPSLEQRMEDLCAVMDAVGCERAALLGNSEGGSMAMLFAATHPQRTSALVLAGAFAKRIWSPDYPWAPTPEQRQHFFDMIKNNWGGTVDVGDICPSRAGDPAFAAWYSANMRFGASPGAALMLAHTNTEIDVRAVLPTIRVPTLVLHRRGDRDAKLAEGEYIARQIPNAKLVVLEGSDHLIWSESPEVALDEIEEFLTGTRHAHEIDRTLATVLFTDIVDSTKHASELGDQRWRDLLARHHALARGEIARYRGREINTAGDGFFATFDGPARAIRCALAIESGSAATLGLKVRAGVHTGECIAEGDNLSGIAVHIGARVGALAGGDEVLVSSAVKDLVAGSGLSFADRGMHTLKGVPGDWHIFAVAH